MNRLYQAKYAKYFNYSNQILQSEKDQKVLFVGYPKMHPTNPRWWTASIFEKLYFSKRLTDFDDLHIMTCFCIRMCLLVITARGYAKRGICRRRVSVCVSVCVCVSVTLRYCIKTTIRRITQTTPHDSPMILVF